MRSCSESFGDWLVADAEVEDASSWRRRAELLVGANRLEEAAELARVVSATRTGVAAMEARNVFNRVMSDQLTELVRRLAEEFARWDGGSNAWCRTTRTRLDRVFGAAGTVRR